MADKEELRPSMSHGDALLFIGEQNKELAKRDAIIKVAVEALEEFACCPETCARTGWSQGEPTPDGGYRTMIKGKWYQSKPVDETPKCDCGLEASLSEIERLKKEQR